MLFRSLRVWVVNRCGRSVVGVGVFAGAAAAHTASWSSLIQLPLVGAVRADDGSVGVPPRGRRDDDGVLVLWGSCLRALCRCAAVSSNVGVGLWRYVSGGPPGSSSLSSAGEGAELVMPYPSSSSCGYEETENYDFPTAWISPESRSSSAPGGSSDGDVAARPGSASKREEDGTLRDLFVIFKFFGGVLYHSGIGRAHV